MWLNFWKSIGSFFLPQLTWTREVADKEVFLTFDDGPHPQITPWVMAELDKVGAKATFFVVGENAEKYFSIVDEMQKSGHRVGNHTHRHIKGWRVSAKKYLEDIADCEDYLTDNTLFRPPYGQINFGAPASSPSLLVFAQEKGNCVGSLIFHHKPPTVQRICLEPLEQQLTSHHMDR